MTNGAAGFDFYAEEIISETPDHVWYRTGFAVDIPNGYWADLRARSSVSKTGLFLANGAGVGDTDYQGELQFRFYKLRADKVGSPYDYTHDGLPYERVANIYTPGDRIGQLILTPKAQPERVGVLLVDEFDEETERGSGGFGSTGR
jgi:dUTP pyrophosphatase